MNKINVILINSILNIYGILDFENIAQTLDSCFNETQNLNNLIIDFKYTSSQRSCILIFMLNYSKRVKKNGQKVKFINVPILLSKMIKVYNLYTLI